MPKKFIQELTIEITNKCNLKCRICGIWKEKPRFIKFSLVHGFIKALAGRYAINSISLTGGEPFLHPQIQQILRLMFLLKKTGAIRCFDINTNGYATRKILGILKENNAFLDGCHIGISLDGLDSRHAQIRGKRDAFKQTFKTIETIKERFGGRVTLRVKFTISEFNYRDIYPFYLFCLKNRLMFSPKISEQNVRNYYHREKAPCSPLNPLRQKNVRAAVKTQLERILLEEQQKAERVIDPTSFAQLIYLVSRDQLPVTSCLTPARCLFLTSEQKIYACLNMKEIGELKDGISVVFGERHNKLATQGLRGNCPGCFAYHGFLNSINRLFTTP
ncbi:MAG: radical SAM protein [Candidatus Omnitrophica bacterium]|nr:radical SAM protein [Candidatus Omnitrophota bacterium]